MGAPASRSARRAALLHAAAAGLALAAGVGGGARAEAGAVIDDSAGGGVDDGVDDRGAVLPQAPGVRTRRASVVTDDGVRLSLIDSSPDAGPGPASAPAAAPGAAPTIVLVPGWCMPATIWRAQLPVLGARWRTLALDPRGQGQSQIPATGYTADRRADDLRDVLAGLERVVLVGWSLGALDALQYVHRHGRQRLLGVMLVDSSVGEPPVPKASDFTARLRKARAATIDDFVRAIFAHPQPEADLRALRDAALRMPLEDSIALLSYVQPREHWRAVALSYDGPLAYVVTPQFEEQARHLVAERPATRVELFEHAGHALFVDEAPRFNRLLSGWIDALA